MLENVMGKLAERSGIKQSRSTNYFEDGTSQYELSIFDNKSRCILSSTYIFGNNNGVLKQCTMSEYDLDGNCKTESDVYNNGKYDRYISETLITENGRINDRYIIKDDSTKQLILKHVFDNKDRLIQDIDYVNDYNLNIEYESNDSNNYTSVEIFDSRKSTIILKETDDVKFIIKTYEEPVGVYTDRVDYELVKKYATDIGEINVELSMSSTNKNLSIDDITNISNEILSHKNNNDIEYFKILKKNHGINYNGNLIIIDYGQISYVKELDDKRIMEYSSILYDNVKHETFDKSTNTLHVMVVNDKNIIDESEIKYSYIEGIKYKEKITKLPYKDISMVIDREEIGSKTILKYIGSDNTTEQLIIDMENKYMLLCKYHGSVILQRNLMYIR